MGMMAEFESNIIKECNSITLNEKSDNITLKETSIL